MGAIIRNTKMQDFYWHNSTRAQIYQKEQNNTKHTCIKNIHKTIVSQRTHMEHDGKYLDFA